MQGPPGDWHRGLRAHIASPGLQDLLPPVKAQGGKARFGSGALPETNAWPGRDPGQPGAETEVLESFSEFALCLRTREVQLTEKAAAAAVFGGTTFCLKCKTQKLYGSGRSSRYTNQSVEHLGILQRRNERVLTVDPANSDLLTERAIVMP